MTLLLVGAALAVAGVVAIARLNQHQQYRGFLAAGDAALADGQPYLAVEAFSGALALRGDSMVAHYRRGEAYAALGQRIQAERDLRQAIQLAPDAPEPLEALGRLFDRQGRSGVAADWYEQATARLHDSDPRLLYALALARYRSGALPQAHDAARRAVAAGDSLAETHYLLGLVAHDLGSTREALGALEQAVRLRPTFADARQELARLYRELGRPDDESAQLQALAEQEATLDRHLALIGAHLRARQPTEALDVLAAAERIAPGDSRVALAEGRVHLALAEAGDPDAVPAALAALERALGGTARRSEGLALYGRALYLSGDTPAAEQMLAEAVRTSPVDPMAYGYLADAAERLGHHLAARDALVRLDALEGDTAAADVRLDRARRIGRLSLAGGDPVGAVRYLSLVTRAGDNSASTLALLAQAYWACGQHDDARQTVGAGLLAAPDDPHLRRLERTFR